MTTSATFTLPMPPSVNRIWRQGKGRTYRSKAYMDWINEAGLKLNVQCVPEIKPPYAVEYAAGKPDNRRRDLTNLVKAMDDLLQAQSVITDDCHIHMSFIHWDAKQEPGTVKVTVRTI